MITIDTTIYVNVANQTYSYVPLGESCEFKLKMDSDKAKIFEHLFLQLNSLEFHNLVRAHLPYIPYHLDEENDEIDTRLKNFMRSFMNLVMKIQNSLLNNYLISIDYETSLR